MGLDLSKVANPLYSLRDKDLFKSKDPQMVSEPFEGTLNKKNHFFTQETFCDPMESLSPQEVIMNGDSPTPTRIIDGIVQVIAPTNAEQKLAKKNELKARETLLMALFDKHQLKFNIHKDAKSLMEAIEKRFGSNKETKKVQKTLLKQLYENFDGQSSESLDQIHDRLQKLMSQLEILVSDVPSISVASSKALVSTLLNVDNLSDAAIYSFFASQSNNPQLDNEDLKQINADDLEEMDLKWQMAMLTMRSKRKCRSPRDNRNKDTQRRTIPVEVSTSNALVSQCSDNKVAPCSKTCSKAYATLQSYYDKLTVDFKKSQFDVLSYKIGYDNQVFKSQVFDCDELNSSESDDSVPTSPVHDRYKLGKGYHDVPPSYTRIFMPPKPDLVFSDAPPTSTTVLNVVHVEFSINNTSKEISKTLRPDAPIIKDWTSDSEDESEPEASVKIVGHPKQAEILRTDNQKPRGHQHSWNRKAYFVCKSLNHLIKDCDFYEKQMVQKPVWNHAMRVNHQNSARMTHPHSNRHVVPTTILTRSRLVSLNAVRPVTTAGNLEQALKDKGVIDSGCSRHMTGKISYLLDFEEINGAYVAFGGNPKGAKITGKLPDENHVLLRVSKENNMYNVDLKNVVPSGDLTCLFAKATLDESNLWHRRLGHINFKTMNKLVKGNLVSGLPSKVFKNNHTCVACKKGKQHRASYPLGKFNGNADEGFLVGYSVNSKAFKVFNSRTRIVQETLHINFLENQPNVAGNGPKWLFDIDTLTQSMNYQPVVVGNQPNHRAYPQNTDVNVAFDVKENKNEVYVSPSRVRDLRDEFEEFSINNTNRVNAASAPVTAVGPNPTNSTNSFNAASPFDNVVSPNFEIGGKSLFVDPSQYPDDPDMPALEDIVHYDDEKDVGAEADFLNLETNISFSPILTTRVYKDHHVTQIISELTSAPQTRSMARMVKEQGGLNQINDEDFHTCILAGFEVPDYPDKVYKLVKTLCGLHQDPRAWYETLAINLLENGFHRGKIDQTLFIKKQKGNILLVQVYVDDIFFGSTNKELLKQKADGIFISQDKYVAKILRKFCLTDGKSASTPIDTEKPLLKEPDGEDVDIHIYIVKRIFRYLKGKPNLGLWYPKDSPFNLVAYFDSDYAGASLDRKSTTRVLINNQVDDLSSHITKYTSPALTQKVFANMGRISKGFSSVETPLFATMLVQPQAAAEEQDEEDEVPTAPTPPSPTHEPSPPLHEPITTPTQAQHAPLSSPPQEQPTTTSASDMNLLNTLIDTCTTLSHKVVALEQDKVAQALEIFKLKRRVKRLEKKRRSKHSGLQRGRIEAIDADEDITLVDIETKVDAELQGRIERKDDDNAAESIVFNGEEVTMTMAQTLIKMKAEKARLLDEQMAKRLHDEEVEQAATREKQEQDDFKRAQELQQQYDQKQENIDWNIVAEQMQEKHLDNIKKYQSLKRKPISAAQARKKHDSIFEEYGWPDRDEEPTKIRVAKETLLQESFKKLKAEIKVLSSESTQDTPTDDPKEMSEEDVKNILEIILITEFKVEALQVKYPLIDWEIYSERLRTYCKIIRVGGINQAYQSFEDMLKDFNREDLDVLWRLVKDKFSSAVPIVDKEKAL
nr:hypothetical protein [Tanacetum cinerariifolium]